MVFKAKCARGHKSDQNPETTRDNNKHYIRAKEVIKMQIYCKIHVIRDRGASRRFEYVHYCQI